MRKFFVRTVPIVTLVVFILIMLSDNVLKKPLGSDDDVPKSIQLVMKDVNDGKWDDADKNIELLSQAWKKVVRRIQFSAEKDEISELDMSIARLRGAIMAKDKSNALIELSEAYEHWENVGR